MTTADTAVPPIGSAKPRLLVFFSETSGACRRVDGYLAAVLQRRKNHNAFEVTRVDVARRPDLAERFDVTSVPALVVVSDRRVRLHLNNPRGPAEIREALASWLSH